jgi:hypothetical protein
MARTGVHDSATGRILSLSRTVEIPDQQAPPAAPARKRQLAFLLQIS